MSLVWSAQRHRVDSDRLLPAWDAIEPRRVHPRAIGQRHGSVGARPAKAPDQAPQPVLVRDVAIGDHREAGQLLFLEDDRDELAGDVPVLVGRDLPLGEPAIGLSEEVGLAGSRLARIVGCQGGEHDDDSQTRAQGGRSSSPCAVRSVPAVPAGGAP